MSCNIVTHQHPCGLAVNPDVSVVDFSKVIRHQQQPPFLLDVDPSVNFVRTEVSLCY